MGYLYQHKLMRYLFVGGTTFMIDFGLLVLLHGYLDLNLQLAASISYWTSILYNFTLNRNWTFSTSEKKALHKHVMAYGILLACNYVFTIAFVSLGSQFMNYTIAKTLAVMIQTLWTYRIYKNIIFTTEPESTSS